MRSLILLLATSVAFSASALMPPPAATSSAPASIGASIIDTAVYEAIDLQISLEREGFSPGLIDAKPGPKTTLAIAEFQKSRNLASAGKLDSATSAALSLGQRAALTAYTISSRDSDMVTGPLPKDWNAKAKMPMVGYQSLGEVVCERFHCSQALLARLNPKLNITALKEGQTLAVPAVYQARSAHVASLEINLSQKVIRGYDSAGHQVALFHCSIAKDAAKRPRGQAHVVSVTREPTYSFDPAMWPEVKNVKSKLLINPGPRNPVGLCWIALSLRGYGIHGTPNPEMIGRTGSHGCFRLTNWDALRLGGMLSPHTPIKFIS